MTNFHEEETLGKAYDSKLMKRLVSYTKPYWMYILICIILLMVVTVGDLARPYILKYAIDDSIRGYLKPMYVFDKSSTVNGTLYEDKLYVREKDLSDIPKEVLQDIEKKTIVKVNGSHYLVDGPIENDIDNPIIEKQDNAYMLIENNKKHAASLLSNDDYKLFRKNDVRNLKNIGIIFLIVIILSFVFNYAQVYILNYTSQKK